MGATIKFVLVFGFMVLLLPVRIVLDTLLNAALLSWTSTTPGKWLCGVRVVSKNGERITFGRALRREAEVLIAGCGLWFPLVNIVAFGVNGMELLNEGETSWDRRRDLVVVQRPNSWWQLSLTLLASAPWMAGWAMLYGHVAKHR